MKRTGSPTFAMSGDTWRCEACKTYVALPHDYLTAFRTIDAHRCPLPKPQPEVGHSRIKHALVWAYLVLGSLGWVAFIVVLATWAGA